MEGSGEVEEILGWDSYNIHKSPGTEFDSEISSMKGKHGSASEWHLII